MFKVSDYARDTGTHLIGDPSAAVLRVSTDSRAIRKGDLYVALKGPNFDGHDFVKEAFNQGASACMVSQDSCQYVLQGSEACIITEDTRQGLWALSRWWRDKFSEHIKVVGVTGSNGKTTVKEMIADILRVQVDPDKVLATKGNFNNEIGVPHTLLELNSGHAFAVVEMGMNHLGELERLTNIVRPDVAVITNIGTAHIGELGSQDAIAEAKSEVIVGLSDGGVLIVEADGQYADYLIGQYQRGSVITFGETANSLLCGKLYQSSGHSVLQIQYDGRVIDVNWHVRGKHNVLNSLAAAATAIALGVSDSSIKIGLESFGGVKGRLETTRLNSGDILINDTYNANFDSVCRALEHLATESGKKIVVLGDMGELGEFGPALHHQVGEFAKSLGINVLLSIGELSKKAVISFGVGGVHHESRDALLIQLRSELDGRSSVLVKGSRFMKMEFFCDALAVDQMNH
ncbi:MAG: UDP-N-acetylmuramoyl-tripeptide--D-alanyl-D-alanine ligase [Proteobacteria bacterium]|nr:UDP-N-acetylmuramoyl-tripeptide--D-alanyl-D-alanine ligase [Pseudomonadota bacterium]MDA1331099.1 UDP-N-acetylmuramoyl-tripeptide--D-alanyl-D-alanine ligase [Pseudomonadota bacterium]